MALVTTVSDLIAHLDAMHEAILSLRTTVVEDRPLEGDVVLVDLLGDATDDLLGWLEGARLAAREGQPGEVAPLDLTRLGRSLIACQERLNRVTQRFTLEIVH